MTTLKEAGIGCPLLLSLCFYRRLQTPYSAYKKKWTTSIHLIMSIFIPVIESLDSDPPHIKQLLHQVIYAPNLSLSIVDDLLLSQTTPANRLHHLHAD